MQNKWEGSELSLFKGKKLKERSGPCEDTCKLIPVERHEVEIVSYSLLKEIGDVRRYSRSRSV